MKKEKMLNEVERLYFLEEGNTRVIKGLMEKEKELKNKNIELTKQNRILSKELKEVKAKLRELEKKQDTNTLQNTDLQQLLQSSFNVLSKIISSNQAQELVKE